MPQPLPVGLAVIGAGYWGPKLVRNAQATSSLRLKWLCDVDTERAAQVLGSYSIVRVTGNYEDVLADPGVHAVAIATPAGTHFDLVRAALEAGKHVLVEKPLTPSVADGRKLVELAEQSGLVLMLDHTYCYTPAVRHLRELVRGGEVGELQYAETERAEPGLVRPDVDVLWDLAPHDLAVLDLVLPDGVVPVSVSAQASGPFGTGRACVAYLSVSLSNGALAHLHVSWLSPTRTRTTVLGGSRRTVVWDDLEPARRVSVYDRGVDLDRLESLDEAARREALLAYRTGDMVVPALPEREPLRGVMAEFSAAIVERRAPLTDGRHGLRVLELLGAASRSLELGGAAEPVGG